MKPPLPRRADRPAALHAIPPARSPARARTGAGVWRPALLPWLFAWLALMALGVAQSASAVTPGGAQAAAAPVAAQQRLADDATTLAALRSGVALTALASDDEGLRKAAQALPERHPPVALPGGTTLHDADAALVGRAVDPHTAEHPAAARWQAPQGRAPPSRA